MEAFQRPARRARIPLVWAAALVLLPGCGGDEPEGGAPPIAGAVASATPEATAAGTRILALGGNAVDAAVAVSLALGVTEPSESGLGGSVVMLIVPATGEPVVLHALPEGVPAEGGAFLRPSALPVLATAWSKYGSGNVSWEDVVEPARRLAERGYVLGRFRHRMLVSEYRRLVSDSLAAVLVLNPDHSIPGEGTIIKLPTLAATLEQLAGTAPDEILGGAFATKLSAAVAEGVGADAARALESPPPVREERPLEGRYRGWTVLVPGDPYPGRQVLRALELLETAPVGLMGKANEVRALWLAEALGYSFDPSAVGLSGYLATTTPLPLSVDTTQRFAAARRPSAAPAAAGEPAADEPSADAPPAAPPAPIDTAASGTGQETSHFSIVDGSGTTVSVTQSLGGPFGQRATRLGFFLGRPPAGGAVAALRADSAGQAIALPGDPWNEPVAWAVPTVLARDSASGLALGSAGGPRAVSAVVQVIADWVDGGRPIERAVATPRLHVDRDSLPRPRLELEGVAWIDSVAGSPAALAPWGRQIRALAATRGLRLGEWVSGLEYLGLSPFFGGVHAVAREGEAWAAAADPRRDGEGHVVSEEDVLLAQQDPEEEPLEPETGPPPASRPSVRPE